MTQPELPQPVRIIPGEPEYEPEGTGLCLSGGGYRAMLFHLGTLWRLNEAGRLRGLARVSSVSGGSITAGTLGAAWTRLTWHGDVATNLDAQVIAPVRELARHTIDISSFLKGLLPFETVGKEVAGAYRKHLFGDATLQDLPDDDRGPRFVICATNLESGVLFRFSRPYLADYRVGMVDDPDTPLADAVAASSAFPPFLSPYTLDLADATWKTVAGNDLTARGYREKITLSDGGVYDNLGLETVWKRCRCVLVSDAGGQMDDDESPPTTLQMLRVLNVIDNQVRDLRKRWTVYAFQRDQRDGTYFGIRSHVRDYGLPDPIVDPSDAAVLALAEVPTRLAKLDDRLQERLINWGYAICDTALRRWVDPQIPRPAQLPYPAAGI